MEKGKTSVLDLLRQKPWDEGPGAAKDSGGHCRVGSGPRGPHTRSRIFCPSLPLASYFLSSSFPTSQMQNHELFCSWVANENIMSAFQHLPALTCHRQGLGMC